MTMKIILWLSTGWIPIITGIMLINETKFKKNITVGVTLPYEAREDADVLQILKRYRRGVEAVCGFLLVLSLICFCFSSETVLMTIWMIWIDLAIILPYVPYAITNIQLKEVKEKKGWKRSEEQRTAAVNLSAMPSYSWISPWVFAPADLICLALILFDPSMFLMYLIFAGCCAFCWFSYRYLYRNKAELVDENTDLTIALSNIRRYNWGKTWILCSYAMSIYAIVMCFFVSYPIISMIMIVAVTAILCICTYRIEFKTRHLQEKLTKDSGRQWYADEDDHWIFGIFYNNPDDSRLLINQRIGINSTVNLARPLGRLMYILLALVIAALPFTGVWMDSIGTQDISMQITENQLTVKSGFTSYRIETDEIRSIELMDALPTNLHRKMGTGMDCYLEGKFTADEIGDVTVLLDPEVSPYLLIQMEDDQYYLFGTRDGEEAEAAYDILRK
ncbi:MAG: DUF5808 domain-containing protein [Solobacterium sp.]|nr:DUF5808 domain-containing protein [Solobacterium sp.]MCH4205429.1 DUF5808 domain-containing protein [Solobacterium sp.]MCH4226641.1 DUF5808 domain-containing protein [Solobacterium sp.]MCH4282116.1 DUF5808 domain-containing protein [Solobacterium sp.]